VGLAWQFAFLIVSRDPVRYRPLMIPGMVEKAAFGAAGLILFALHRTAVPIAVFSSLDLLWGLPFLAAHRRTAAGKMRADPIPGTPLRPRGVHLCVPNRPVLRLQNNCHDGIAARLYSYK